MSSPLFFVDKTLSLGNWVTFHFSSALLLSSLCYCKQAPENNKPTTHFFLFTLIGFLTILLKRNIRSLAIKY